MKILEIQNLTEQWVASKDEPLNPTPNNAAAVQGLLHDRLTILHRLNELGEVSIDGMPLIVALEQTNELIRQTGLFHMIPSSDQTTTPRKAV